MNRFEVGDLVFIKPLSWFEENCLKDYPFSKNDLFYYYLPGNLKWRVHYKFEYFGKIVEIKKVNKISYSIEYNQRIYDWMITGKTEKFKKLKEIL
jgi:hypothetical protein